MSDTPYDKFGAILRYEANQLTWEEFVELFQHLVDSGEAWHLQGHYGRTAKGLIADGYVTEPQ